MVAGRGKLSNELVVGEASGLWKAVHPLADFDIHKAVVEEGLQVVLFDDCVGEEPDGNAHVFVAFHWCTEVKILEIGGHEHGIGRGEDAVKK